MALESKDNLTKIIINFINLCRIYFHLESGLNLVNDGRTTEQDIFTIGNIANVGNKQIIVKNIFLIILI